MKPKILLKKHIDYVFEGCQLLTNLADEGSDGGYGKLRETLSRKYRVKLAEYMETYIDLMEEITLSAAERFSDEMPQIKKYFGRIEDRFSVAELGLCIERVNVGFHSQRNAEEVLAHYRRLTEQERDGYFLTELDMEKEQEAFDQVIGCNARGIVVPEAVRVKNLLSYIRKLDLKPENRSFVEDVYLNRDAYVEEMVPLLDQAIGVLKEYESRLLSVAENWEMQWRNVIDTGEFENVFGSTLGKLKEDIVVVPSFVQCSVLWVSIDSGLLKLSENFMPFWRLGVALSREFFADHRMKEEYQFEEYQKILKALGDKSKLDILLFVKDKPSYGTEIAKQFHLTTATVSHHMNQLLQLELVQVEVKEKRVYYQTQKERLQEVFDACKRMFQ